MNGAKDLPMINLEALAGRLTEADRLAIRDIIGRCFYCRLRRTAAKLIRLGLATPNSVNPKFPVPTDLGLELRAYLRSLQEG